LGGKSGKSEIQKESNEQIQAKKVKGRRNCWTREYIRMFHILVVATVGKKEGGMLPSKCGGTTKGGAPDLSRH